jgi:lysophospholipase L1-like esterase
MQTLDSVRLRQSVSKLDRSTPLRIIAIGDSSIYGYGDPIGGGWVERLRRQWMSIEDDGHVLYNLGVRGDGVKQVAARIEAEFSRRGELRNRYPDVIILSVGINDSARLGRLDGKQYTPREEFQQQIDHLVDVANQLCPVLFVGMTPVNENKMPFLDCFYYNHRDQYEYKEITKQICDRRNIPYLDIFDLWIAKEEDWRRSQLANDGLHLNPQGYQNLLEDILNWERMKKCKLDRN